MSVSAAEVKKLRDKTGAGMMDCKKALMETKGDIEKAVENLRKKGIASAQKREGRMAKEGAIMTYLHPGNRIGVMIELNCETDFVAKTDDFIALWVITKVGSKIYKFPNSDINEKITEYRKIIYPELKSDEVIALTRDFAMQIAATNPIAITREEIPKKLIDSETEIYREQIAKEKKPPEVVDKIIKGKLEKYYQETVLMEQNFVKDSSKTVKEHLLEISGRLGEAMAIRRFVRFQLGEEI